MACANSDVDDFVTCGVCLNEYDTENKKPKFLQCSHTLCLQCLKVYSLLIHYSHYYIPCINTIYIPCSKFIKMDPLPVHFAVTVLSIKISAVCPTIPTLFTCSN